MHRLLPLTALALSLAGCTHFGTNITGDFSCRSPKTGCQPLSEVDAKAIRALVKSESSPETEARQRITVPAVDTSRTGERTLRIVFPAHVDGWGTLHDEAIAWTVVEAARWAGELRRDEIVERKGTMRALRQALEHQARRASDAARLADTALNSEPLSPEGSAPANPFLPSSPLALPSPGGEAQTDVTMPVPATSAAEGSDMSLPPHVRAPRSLEEITRVWPSAAGIEAAKAPKAKAESAPKKEPK